MRVLLDGAAVIAHGEVGVTAAEVGPGVLRVEKGALAEIPERALVVLLRQVQAPATGVGVDVIGTEFDGLVVVGEGLVGVVSGGVGVAAAGTGVRAVRDGRDGLGVGRDRLVVFAIAVMCQALLYGPVVSGRRLTEGAAGDQDTRDENQQASSHGSSPVG